MMKKEAAFNEIIRKVRKDLFGKGPEKIYTYFVENMAVTKMHGNLTVSEKFISKTAEGQQMIHNARTVMIQELYKENMPEGLEELVGSKLLHLFNDIKIEEDLAISVFIFEKPVR
ncbi:DUF2294 domain-containing protein [Domibacillus sp. DTU_2020_1001157_1_SI_ALB_TIR_016]|uniref:DUF2294 domain-containing protein n=1 Tax=Domibacillus TaxID=1433999 RepID=UPI0028EC2556|nr:DUF2294 domain-containing protein [Domibacillus sp. DTU_2020_1001157_1_SI_ALB_TIR_016]WNS78493.1 DUF2294 domain-containing protein [Domibacillus sp. DTU_2020_1001157_1_SI_ALB_TIR_016]